MATVLVLLGSILGFFTAVVTWTMLDFSFVSAMGIWMLSGPAAAILVMAMGRISSRPQSAGDAALIEA